MVAGCGAKISKMILFVFNFLIWLVAILLIGLAGFVLARSADFSDFFSGSANTLDIACGVIIAVGCLIFFLAFAGCFGAMKESGCLLKVYIAVLFVLVLLEIVGGVLALVYREKIEEVATDFWVDEVTSYAQPDADYDPDKPKFVDTIQVIFKCCGTDKYDSWRISDYRTANAGSFVPLSCCKDSKDAACNDQNTLGTDIDDKNMIYTKGCTKEVVEFFKSNFLIIGVTALALVAAEILAMIFAGCVICGINKGEYDD